MPSNEAQLLKGALTPTFIVGVVAIGFSIFMRGTPGFFGALLAQAVVLIYFLVHIFVSKISRRQQWQQPTAVQMQIQQQEMQLWLSRDT